MFGIGAEELLLIFIVALLVLGPERLPGLARDVGKAMSELRKASDELTTEFLKADQAPPAAPAPAEPPPAVTAETPPALEASAPERASEAPPAGDQPTAFDQEAQRAADEEPGARSESQPPASWVRPEAPAEPERWG